MKYAEVKVMSHKILFLADPHLSATPPSSRVDDYAGAIFNKLDQVTDIVKKMEIDAVVVLGDVFHLKSWTRNPYWLTNKFIEWLKAIRDSNCQIMVLVGNHDVPFGRVDLAFKQPIGAVTSLDFVKSEIVLENPKVRIKALHYNPDFTAKDLNVAKQDEQYLILCAHQCILPSGQFFDEPTVTFPEVLTEADVIAYGHIHAPTVVQKVEKTWFINPGALSRGSTHRDNLERIPCVVVLKIDETIQYVTIKLDVAKACDIFDLNKKKRQEDREGEVEQFVELLQASTSEINESDPLSVLESMDVSSKVKNIARTYLDGDRLVLEDL